MTTYPVPPVRPTPRGRRTSLPGTLLVGLSFVTLLGLAGCKSNAPAPIVNGNTADAGDPADGNLAPVNGAPAGGQVLAQSASYQPQQQGESYQQQAPAPIVRQSPATNDQSYSDENQADDQTNQPPPPLPDYDQPPNPEPDYLWTPGYWAWGQGGYYWVPGAWCPPPYYGALWTPPYWGYDGGYYRFHHGYWGPHVGYYGGIDYGFGYIGIGYFGGYWNHDHFYYNRAVTHVNDRNVHNVYDRPVVYDNRHYNGQPINRTSYNGGRGGITVQPRPAERVAMRETHTGPLRDQQAVRQQAAGNRQQFYTQNHGKPQQAAMARPTVEHSNIAAPSAAIRQQQQRGPGRADQPAEQQQRQGVEQQRQGAEQQRPGAVQQREGAQQQFNRPQPPANRNEQQNNRAQPEQTRPTPQNRTESRPQQGRPEQPQARPTPQNRQEQQPQARPESQPQARPQQQSRPEQQARPQQQSRPEQEARPQQQSRPEQQARPQPAARPEQHAAPASRPESRPAPESRPEERPH